MIKVYPEDFDPYPGCFLKNDLNEKIRRSSELLSEEYLARGDVEGSEEALRNIILAQTDAVPDSSPFQDLCILQKLWQEMMEYTYQEKIRSRIENIVQKREESK